MKNVYEMTGDRYTYQNLINTTTSTSYKNVIKISGRLSLLPSVGW